MKFLASLLLIASLASLSLASTQIWGHDTPGSALLFNTDIFRPGYQEVTWDINIQFPISGAVNNKVITKVAVYDNSQYSYGAQPTLLAGGPGSTYVSIDLKGVLSKFINSSVEIYGLDVYNYNLHVLNLKKN